MPKTGSLTGAILAAVLLVPAQADAFSLFGIHLWGAREEEDRVEVIDPLNYTVTIAVSGGGGSLRRQLESASALYSDRETPASGTGGLLSKARGDYRRLLAALYADGYYGPAISIRAAGREVADLTLAVEFPDPVPVVIEVATGPQFDFGRTEIVNAPPWDESGSERDDVELPASVGFETGETARSGVINRASALAVERWRQLSWAKAREADREVIADHPTDRLDVTLTMEPGRPAHYGTVTTSGSRRTKPEFILYMANLPEGHPFDPDDIAQAQRRLTGLGIFRSLRFVEAEEIAPDGSLPIAIEVEDRRPRTIGFGATLSTIDGLGVSAFWVNRNLFGRGEQLRFDIGVDGLGQSLNPDDYDYSAGVSFTRPGTLTPDTDMIAALIAQRVDYDTYREKSVTARLGLQQVFGERLTGGIFAEISRARYEDGFGTRTFSIFALAGNVAYDRRNVPLDATRGYYLAATATPFYEAEYDNAAVQGTVEARAYHTFGGDTGKVTLAGRALIGSYLGPDAAESPPDMLFFAGGGGSVRGYPYRSIGIDTVDTPDDENFETFVVGGAGLIEGSAELRYRFSESWGAVGFVDTGYVTETAGFGGETNLRTGAGLGVRYYTPIGVLRGDLATPLNPLPGDSRIALYIGIGQAF